MNRVEAWYTVDSEQEIDSPALLIFPERIRHNIQLAIAMIGDVKRLRPHVKTHKSKHITQLQQEAGIQKFKCATIAEAQMLADCGAEDVLLAYPVQGPKVARLLRLIQQYPQTRFSTLIDAVSSAKEIARMANELNLSVDVFVDLDLGMGRTGILLGDEALALYRFAASTEGLNCRGFHGYDGHVRDLELEKRKIRCEHSLKSILKMTAVLQAEGIAKPELVMGGSPTFPVYVDYPEVECSPGTFVLWDKGYTDLLPEQHFLPAAVLLARVVSIPAENHLCLDLGYKAVASENPLENRFFFLNATGIIAVGQSEEHLVVRHRAEEIYAIGDIFYALPVHVCPTVALYDELYVVNDGQLTATWQVDARGR
ncbi:D-TA family PLP-dependent enzyme [Sphingobacterium bambusae]|uniref:D-TA family PLP-dependent enzyme n=1 Tax=Sphingobacterium bambusae TaxID=662858 RepID=A0ABW6BH02_9SPHI|nr:D-TA family PLP-dependent enzyme [Sphingobacterium bambusae]WPL47492.1 D-TA family PLP-dependent enzyme [Sphingobacterium bambusae]